MKNLTFLLLILLTTSPHSFADNWRIERTIDDTGEITCSVMCAPCGENSYKENSVGIVYTRAYLRGSNNLFFGVFFVGQTSIRLFSPSSLAQVDENKKIFSYDPVPNSFIDIYVKHLIKGMKIHIPESYNIKTYVFLSNDPYPANSISMLEQVMKGQRLKITNGDGIVEIDLTGFTKAYNEYQECELLKKMGGV